jgi:hypothetical protein
MYALQYNKEEEKATVHGGLEKEKEVMGIPGGEQDEKTLEEVRGVALLELEKKLLDDQVELSAKKLSRMAKVPNDQIDAVSAAELAEGFKKEFHGLRNQLDELAMACPYVSYESEFDVYRQQLERRIKLIEQFVEPNRKVVELLDKTACKSAKQAITRGLNSAKSVITHIDKWKETNLIGTMLSNRKNRTSICSMQIVLTQVRRLKKKGLKDRRTSPNIM